MKQVININFQGRVVPIEQTAYDILRSYIDSLHRFFANEEGKEEIVNDIENRIGELFQQRLQNGTSCITDEDVDAVITSMGRTEEFEEQEMGGAATNTSNNQSEGNTKPGAAIFTRGHRLYRDENDKILGGVCSGLAHYFNVDVVVVRVIFAILFFSAGIGFIPYIILWVVVPSTATQQIGSVRKKLYRDTDNKYVAGVCSGLANYFGIKTWIPRVLFLIPLLSFISKWGRWGGWEFHDIFRLSFSPSALIIYVILWLVIPEANTTSEKLEMKGEKVDMNSIKNSVRQEFKGVSERANKFSQEISAAATGATQNISSDMSSAGRNAGNGLGKIVSLLVKIILYTIAGSLLIALIIGLFVIAVVSVGVFPLKDFLLSGTWQNVWAWGTLIFFIAVPIVGLITFIIRRVTKAKRGGMYVRGSFIALWIIGWVCATLLVSTVSKNFRVESRPQPNEIVLNNPGINKLEITTNGPDFQYTRHNALTFRPYDWVEDDTAIVHNIKINILKSTNDSFRVVKFQTATGYTTAQANNAASLINFNVYQQDSLLVLEKGIKINKTDKFRNQQITLNVYVPVGKQIRINNNIRSWDGVKMDGFGVHNDDFLNDDDYDNTFHGWENNHDYIMQADGLFTLDGVPADKQKFREKFNGVKIDDQGIRVKTKKGVLKIDDNGINMEEDTNNDSNYNYRYNNDGTPPQKVKPAVSSDELRRKDSLQKSLEKTQKELEKINATSGQTARNAFVLPGYNPTLWLN